MLRGTHGTRSDQKGPKVILEGCASSKSLWIVGGVAIDLPWLFIGMKADEIGRGEPWTPQIIPIERSIVENKPFLADHPCLFPKAT